MPVPKPLCLGTGKTMPRTRFAIDTGYTPYGLPDIGSTEQYRCAQSSVAPRIA